MKTLDKTQKGFTLIELMIVVAIIGILAAVAIPAYTYYIERAISIEPLQLVKVLHDAVRLYYTENEKLPEVGTESQAIPNWDKNSHGYYVDKIVIEKVDTSVDIIVTYGVYMNQEAIHKAKQKAQIKLDEWAKTASLIYDPSFFISSAFAQSVQLRPRVNVY